MSNERLLLSEKYKAFLKCNAPVEFLEGTTAAGKTTVEGESKMNKGILVYGPANGKIYGTLFNQDME